jgi:hypothetical protein
MSLPISSFDPSALSPSSIFDHQNQTLPSLPTHHKDGLISDTGAPVPKGLISESSLERRVSSLSIFASSPSSSSALSSSSSSLLSSLPSSELDGGKLHDSNASKLRSSVQQQGASGNGVSLNHRSIDNSNSLSTSSSKYRYYRAAPTSLGYQPYQAYSNGNGSIGVTSSRATSSSSQPLLPPLITTAQPSSSPLSEWIDYDQDEDDKSSQYFTTATYHHSLFSQLSGVPPNFPHGEWREEYRWNEVFQQLVELPEDDDMAVLDKYTKLAMLSVDFVETAQTYGKLIIEEHLLPEHLKTIRPLGLGGTAGTLSSTLLLVLYTLIL